VTAQAKRQERLRFGPYQLDLECFELRKSGIRLKIAGQPLEVLGFLMERAGSMVSREELRNRLWPVETFVDFEHSLNTAIKRLRAALDDDSEYPRYVETVRGYGYRFIGTVEQETGGTASGFQPRGIEPTDSHIPAPNTPVASGATRKYPVLPWVVACILIGVVAGIWYLRLRFRTTPVPGRARAMLVVLPFQNLGSYQDEGYFGDGLTEETITDLGQLSPGDLGVIARTSAMAYKHTSKTAGEIGRELGVDYILEGSVRREGERVRVSAQLIRVQDQTHLWAHNYDRELKDLLAVENELGEAITKQVQLKLTPKQEIHLARTVNANPEAYEAYLKARYFWFQFRLDSLNKSIAYYNQALQKDPNYAAAYAGLAASYSVRANLYTAPREDYPKAKAAAMKALQLDDTLPSAHQVMAAIHIFYDWDWAGAEQELSRVRELDPNSTTADNLQAYYFEAMGRPEDAISLLKRTLQLDPLSALVENDLGWAYYFAHRTDEAIAQEAKTLEIDPYFPLAHIGLGVAYEQKEDLSAAAEEYRKANDLGHLASVQARRGYTSEAKAIRKELAKRARQEYVDPLSMTILCIGMGDEQAGINWLQAAYQNRSAKLIWLKVDPTYDRLRSNPRFLDLQRAMGLPD
jgi:TolB-like protein/DNA-binding winged helix-turn-helix (wHTH) protein/Tfp pilus assembly protein PilF